MGASHLDIDTEQEIVIYYLLKPQKIDVATIKKATQSAGYTPSTIRVRLRGQAARTAQGLRFEVDQSGQTFAVEGKIDANKKVEVVGEITSEVGTLVRLKIDKVTLLDNDAKL